MEFGDKIKNSIGESIRLKSLILDKYPEIIESCGIEIADRIAGGGKVLFCGNGGSAADSQHLAAELVVRLRGHINRPALPALALTVDPSIMTAGGNDIGFENVFARGVEAYGSKGDVLVAISTSGNSENVLRAVYEAKKRGLLTVGLLGKDGGKLATACDMSVIVPSDSTARIQEVHITIGHIWCEIIEEKIFPEYFEK